MSGTGGVLLFLAAGYLAFLCASALRVMKLCAAAKTPVELLKAVVNARRHYGVQSVGSFISAAILAGVKGVAMLAGHYDNPNMLIRLALGTTDDGFVGKLGLVACVLIGVAIVEAVSFVRYDAYLRMIFALRKLLNLDLQITPDPPK